MDAGSIGAAALWASLAASLGSLVVLAPGRGRWSRRLLGVSATLGGISCLGLLTALVGSDFSLEYVARTTSRATPWPYRVAALWGAMEGSLLFYATLALLLGWAGTRQLDPARARWARIVVGVVGSGLLALTALMASPFERLDIPPVDGEGLLAILQHPAMVYHPPILYLGLTSLLAPFAVTVGTVLAGKADRGWVREVRRPLLASWTLLTLGMVAGANWAYVELGWGGFWAWDPVENTSLMPWMAVTVFLHSSRVQERDGRLARWNVAFALLPFVLTLLGVYLTRSGATGSIHAFAESPVIGRVLLTSALAFLVLGLVLTMRTRRGEPWERVWALTRDTWLAGNAALVTIALVFVVIGSAYPAYLQVFFGEETVVRSAFFINAILPIALLLAIGLGFGLDVGWSRARIGRRHIALFLFGGLIALASVVTAFGSGPGPALALAGLAGGGLAILADHLVRRRYAPRLMAAHLAHVGMTLVILGGAGSALGADFTGVMAPGEEVEVGGYTVSLDSIATGEGDRFIFVLAEVSLRREARTVAVLLPEIRAYEEQALPVPEPALRSTPAEDVVVAISRVAGDASVVQVNVFVRPLVMLVWIGALVIVVAGLLALGGRDGGGAGPRRRARAAQQPAGTTT